MERIDVCASFLSLFAGFTYFSVVFILAYSIQYLTESQKNFDADMTNPNYNTIDDKDHVYDEIKHKDGYKDLGNLLYLFWLNTMFFNPFFRICMLSDIINNKL